MVPGTAASRAGQPVSDLSKPVHATIQSPGSVRVAPGFASQNAIHPAKFHPIPLAGLVGE